MVNADIDLSPSEQHPLPWYPPLCDSEKFKDLKLPTRFQSLPGIIWKVVIFFLLFDSLPLPSNLKKLCLLLINVTFIILFSGFSTSMSKEKFPDESIKGRFLYSFGLNHEMKV